jgi:hypothetical protein
MYTYDSFPSRIHGDNHITSLLAGESDKKGNMVSLQSIGFEIFFFFKTILSLSFSTVKKVELAEYITVRLFTYMPELGLFHTEKNESVHRPFIRSNHALVI